MHVRIISQFSGIFSKKVGKKIVNDAIKITNIDIAKEWHRDYLPNHFTHSGARLYGYLLRHGEGPPPYWSPDGLRRIPYKHTYTGHKKKKFGHTDPYNYTGVLKDAALSDYIINDKKLSRSTVTVSFPLHNANRSKRIGPVAADELTRVTASEEYDLSLIYVDRLAANLRSSIPNQ